MSKDFPVKPYNQMTLAELKERRGRLNAVIKEREQETRIKALELEVTALRAQLAKYQTHQSH